MKSKRVVQFCHNNKPGQEAVDLLQREYGGQIEVRVMDCFRRCLECRKRPFCRMQLRTIEAEDTAELIEKIMAP
ncbi:DUF1450 domain-containing protein [Ectobacillus ponti]|uniref:YuzB family protein n=1 Tax=Ectobacillus ponti TaxID=2961894 RepID=A0AA41X6S8_9BACI|nr:DUF1450 domain-containing protein [Ectobacillus ponti]MCP8969989.1 YuzB family protein [Ectobacillus ponti]